MYKVLPITQIKKSPQNPNIGDGEQPFRIMLMQNGKPRVKREIYPPPARLQTTVIDDVYASDAYYRQLLIDQYKILPGTVIFCDINTQP